MAALSTQTSARGGTAITAASAAGGGDSFANSGKEMIWIKNGDSSSMTLTIATNATTDGLTVPNRTVAVAAGATKLIGPFPTPIYNDVNGNVQLTYSAVTSLTVAILAAP